MDLRFKSLSSRLLVRLIGLLILLLLVAGSDAAPRKSGKSSLFSLFNLKAKSKFWTESVIRSDFDDLEASVSTEHSKLEEVNYTNAVFLCMLYKWEKRLRLYLNMRLKFYHLKRMCQIPELDERMHDLKSQLEGYNSEESDESQKRKALDALKRMENWNLFSDTYEEFQSYTVARDSFLAHLGATFWGSLRHIIAPSVVDGAYHYYEKISFQ